LLKITGIHVPTSSAGAIDEEAVVADELLTAPPDEWKFSIFVVMFPFLTGGGDFSGDFGRAAAGVENGMSGT
jgi:hypothetical protein